jgi:hypothetical protein
MKTTLLSVILLSISFSTFSSAFAQVYRPEWGKRRHRFAQLELGTNTLFAAKSGTTQVIGSDGNIKNLAFGATQTTAFYIGATHFWGHADIGVNIPIFSSGEGMRFGSELLVKYYPISIESNKIRPYVGIEMAPFGYNQNDGSSISKTYFPLLAGVNYSTKKHQFEAGLVYNYDRKFDYHISRTTIGNLELPKFMFNLTYKYTLETTAAREKNWLNGETKAKTEALSKAKKLNAFSVAVGPSAAFVLSESPYLKENYPFMGNHTVNIFFDLGLGYYLYKPDIHLNLAYRSNSATLEGYGLSNKLSRQSITFEAYKFLGDYHGFLPFIGPNISYENLSMVEQDGNKAPIFAATKGIRVGVSFGWDIRPDDLQGWILRTNLRWQPNLGIDMPDGKKMKFDQLEFNFIQLVLYPERLWGKKLIPQK